VKAAVTANNRRAAAVRHLIVSEVARRIDARPKDISDLFYQRRLDDRRCPVVGGRRLIPEDYIPAIEQVLRDSGRLQANKEPVNAA
jgi:hypothetical protein